MVARGQIAAVKSQMMRAKLHGYTSACQLFHLADTHVVAVVRRPVSGLGRVADQYHLLAGAAGLSGQTRIIQHGGKRLTLKVTVILK